LICCLIAGFSPGRAEILIDGLINDWGSVPAVPVPAAAGDPREGLGRILTLKVTTDDDFVFVLIGFGTPRPFTDPRRQDRLAEGFWDDFAYVEIDADGDGQWDYKTQMTKGKRIGVNNLAVLRSLPSGSAGLILLPPEGHKDYLPLGPRACFTADGRWVESRLPRQPLRLASGRIFLRGCVTFRDAVNGSGAWTTVYFPPAGRWIGLDLRPAPPEGYRLSGPMSLNRQLEPFVVRDEFERMMTPEALLRRSAWIFPRRRPSGLPLAASGPMGEPTPRFPVPSPQDPVLILDPTGRPATLDRPQPREEGMDPLEAFSPLSPRQPEPPATATPLPGAPPP